MKNLLIIDPQNDFVDPHGSLFVPKSQEAIKEICRYIMINSHEIENIMMSLDSHHPWHISNSCYWKESPKLYTKITKELVTNETFNPLDEESKPEILKGIETNGPITIWPEHCIIGTWGHNIPSELYEVLRAWEIIKKKPVTIITKGTDHWFESYSIFTKETLYPFMSESINDKIKMDMDLVICGFAKDICVAETVKFMRTQEKYKNKLKFLEAGLAAINPKNCDIYQDCIENFGATLI